MPKINPAEILTFLAECFPQTFVFENYRRHLPLKIGIDRDIMDRCPAISRRERNVTLRFYASRVAYLQSLVEGAARVDLDGNVCGEVSSAEAAFAAARLAAEREAKRAAKKTAAVPASPTSNPASASESSTSEPASPAMSTRVQRPLLRLPAFR